MVFEADSPLCFYAFVQEQTDLSLSKSWRAVRCFLLQNLILEDLSKNMVKPYNKSRSWKWSSSFFPQGKCLGGDGKDWGWEDDFVFLKGFWVSWELDQSYTAGVPMWAWRMTHHGFNSVPSIMVLVVCTESFWPRAACGQAPQSTLSQPIPNRTARDGSPLVLSPGKQEATSQNAWLCSWWLRAHPIPELESLAQRAGWDHNANTGAQLPLALPLLSASIRSLILPHVECGD